MATTRNARAAWLVATFIATIHAFLAVTAVNTKSPTFDEPQHLTAGFSYWKTNDFRLDPENGNLTARWAALPLILDGPKFLSPNDRAWQNADAGVIAHRFFYELGNDPDRMMGQARLMMSIFGMALCLLVYRIGREFFGIIGGLIAETLLAVDPNFLGHSPLVTADVAAAFFFTATLWTSWRLFQKISPGRLMLAALSFSALFLTKFSAPIVLPVLGVISILQIFSGREIALSLGKFRVSLTEKLTKACAIGAAWIILGLALFAAIWLSFSFRYSGWSDNVPNHEEHVWHWSHLLEGHSAFENTISFARDHHFLPEACLYGFAYVQKYEGDRVAFLDNHWSIVGFSSFFPLAFLYKTPLPLLCLIIFAIWAAIMRREPPERLLNPFLLFVLIYGAFAIRTHLNIGHRHILPIYPALFIACGAVVYFLQTSRRMIFSAAIVMLLLWHVGESFSVRPNYLAYFNVIAGGPARGYAHLIDSSLDWGQDLPALKTWIDDHSSVLEGKPLYLAYFGVADPTAYRIYAKQLPENHSTGDQTFAPLRAGVYCVSATTLQSVYAHEIGPWSRIYEQQYETAIANVERYRATASNPSARIALISNDGAVFWMKEIQTFERLRFERLCAYLRHRAPEAQIGYSIFAFNLSDDDLDHALYGPPAELTDNISVAGY